MAHGVHKIYRTLTSCLALLGDWLESSKKLGALATLMMFWKRSRMLLTVRI